MNFLKKYQLKHFNFILVIAVLILSIIGILAVGSATPGAQSKQILGVCIGFVMMMVIAFVDFEWVLNFYWVIYCVNIFLLLYVKFFGVNYNGAQRWIDLKFTTLQPSDLTKIFLILWSKFKIWIISICFPTSMMILHSATTMSMNLDVSRFPIISATTLTMKHLVEI